MPILRPVTLQLFVRTRERVVTTLQLLTGALLGKI